MGKALLKPATKGIAFAKVGIFGHSGSGKTCTATKFAIGLHRYIKSKKKVAFFDTETGSAWAEVLFKKYDIGLDVCKSIAFSDLSAVLKESVGTYDILIVDSLTHPWKEIQVAYKARNKRTKHITIRGWLELKELWNTGFSQPFVAFPLHIIWCARLGNIFEEVPDDESDDDEATRQAKTGVKPSTETEAGYEPGLLIQMVKKRSLHDGRYEPTAVVVKDRNMDEEKTLMGKEFQKPGFKEFLSHIQCLNIGGEHTPVDTTRTSAGEFNDQGRTRVQERINRRKAALEDVKESLKHLWPTTKGAKQKGAVVLALFGTLAWEAEIEGNWEKHPLEACEAARIIVTKLRNAVEADPAYFETLTGETVKTEIEKFKKQIAKGQ